MSAFDAAVAMLVKSRGGSATYTQGTVSRTAHVLIEKDFEIINPDTGAGQIIKAGTIAKQDFPFSTYKKGDTITQNSVTYTVQHLVVDDDSSMTLELK